MNTILKAGVAGIAALALVPFAGARGGDDHALSDALRAEVTGAFERAMNADVVAEWTAIASRMCAGEKSRCEETGHCDLSCDCAPSGELLAYHLQTHPAAWEVVAPLVESRFADAAQRARALDILASAGAQEPAQKLAAALVEKNAKAFSRDHLLAFLAAGVEPVREEVARRAKSDVRLAAATAMVSGDAGKAEEKRLAKAAKQALADDGALLDAYAAAAALKRLGEEEHWSTLQARVESEVIHALDDGAIDRARDLALGAQFCVLNLGGAKGYGLGYLESRLAFHRATSSGEATDADQVFDLISSVASR